MRKQGGWVDEIRGWGRGDDVLTELATAAEVDPRVVKRNAMKLIEGLGLKPDVIRALTGG